MRMDIIGKIEAKLRKYPQLSYRIEGGTIDVDPATEQGFSEWLTDDEGEIIVGFDGWHTDFQDETEALDCFAWGLSDQCQLKVIMHGSTAYAWVAERKDGSEWRRQSTTALIFVPFWRKRRVEYLQNAIIKMEGDNTSVDSWPLSCRFPLRRC